MNTLDLYRWSLAKMVKSGYNGTVEEWFATDQETLELFLKDQTKAMFVLYHEECKRSPSGYNIVRLQQGIKGFSYDTIIVDEFRGVRNDC